MKTKYAIFLLTLISLFSCTCAILADGIDPVTNQYQQSYPIPQMYPIGQYPNPGDYTQPYQPQPYYPQPYYPQPYYPQPYQPQPYQPQPCQPYYDPISGKYFYPICDDIYPSPYQPEYPSDQDYNVQVSKNMNNNGTISLNWMIRNITNENWDRKNVDIKCISGCHLLTNPNQTLWDIPYTVNRNDMLSFTVRIWEPMYRETMSFAIVSGSKTIYTFNVNPN